MMDFPACHVRLTWRVMPAFHVSETNSKPGGFEAPDVQEKKTYSLALSLPKKKSFFLASLKGQVRDCL